METKSRYKVISELENKKRELIKEKNSLNDVLVEKQKQFRLKERQKEDNIVILNRHIEDSEEELSNFEKTMENQKETLTELIKSIDESLARFGSMLTSK